MFHSALQYGRDPYDHANRTNSTSHPGGCVRDLAANMALPRQVRTEAYRLLRHFPSVSDVEAIAANEAHLQEVTKSPLRPNLLVTEFDPEWLRGYLHGPHVGG